MSFPPARSPVLDPARRPAHLATLRMPLGQIAGIVLIATIVAWLSGFWPPVPWTPVIWLGSSLAIAFFANKGAARLWFAPVLAAIFLAALVGNEAVAHLVFGTCLYD